LPDGFVSDLLLSLLFAGLDRASQPEIDFALQLRALWRDDRGGFAPLAPWCLAK